MKVDKHNDGATCWMDLATPDIAGAANFYSGLFGWSTVAGPPETGGYTQCFVNGEAVAAIGPKMMPEMPTAWSIHFQSSNVDATVAKAQELGANVLMGPMDVMTFGRMAIVMDPVGAVFGVWQPNDMKGATLVDEHGSWAWSELMTSDLKSSEAFYSALFGWAATPSSATGGEYLEMKIGDSSVAGIMARPEHVPAEVPNFWGLYFTIDSLDDALSYVSANGGQVVVGPMAIEPGVFAQFLDPQGAMLGLLEPKKA